MKKSIKGDDFIITIEVKKVKKRGRGRPRKNSNDK